MTFPPCPCLSIWAPAARAINQDWVTLASITSRKSSGFWSTIFDTLFWPDATTRISTRPNVLTAAATISLQLASELGRLATVSTLPPSFSHSPATFLSSAALLAHSTTLAPAPASTFAASAPNAPVAPVTIAVLPRTSNSESGFFRMSSDMALLAKKVGAPGDASAASLHRRHRNRDGADVVATVDDLAVLVGADVAAVTRLHDHLLAAGDHGKLAGQHVVDLLRRRGVGTGAAAGLEM